MSLYTNDLCATVISACWADTVVRFGMVPTDKLFRSRIPPWKQWDDVGAIILRIFISFILRTVVEVVKMFYAKRVWCEDIDS